MEFHVAKLMHYYVFDAAGMIAGYSSKKPFDFHGDFHGDFRGVTSGVA
jgi:hypothetical protein